MLTAGRSGKSHSTRDAFDNEKVSEVDDLKQGKNININNRIICARVILCNLLVIAICIISFIIKFDPTLQARNNVKNTMYSMQKLETISHYISSPTDFTSFQVNS